MPAHVVYHVNETTEFHKIFPYVLFCSSDFIIKKQIKISQIMTACDNITHDELV